MNPFVNKLCNSDYERKRELLLKEIAELLDQGNLSSLSIVDILEAGTIDVRNASDVFQGI
ncbi:MAG: hypothetical protein JWN56_23 [Sphingobacteriales bacterium]|nr:hypothetical protein [Sphingobacteriales bacterium]